MNTSVKGISPSSQWILTPFFCDATVVVKEENKIQGKWILW